MFWRKLFFKIILFFLFLNLFTLLSFASGLSLKELFRRGYNFYQEGQYDEAIDAAEQVLDIHPQFYPAYNLIGFSLAKEKKDILGVVFYLEKSLAIEPRQPQIYNLISNLYNEMGMETEGFSFIRKGLKYNPDNFLLNFNAGLTYLLVKHNPHQAVAYFEAAAVKQPDNRRLLYLLGVSYLFSDQKEMVLDLITSIRRREYESEARELERIFQMVEAGEIVDFGQVIKFYTQQPAREIEKEPAQDAGKQPARETERQREKDADISVGRPETRIEGRGKIQIKQRFRLKQRED